MSENNELTNREKEVVNGIAKGKTNKEISSDLGISIKTLETHMKNIHLKLNTHDKVGVTLWVKDNSDKI